MASLWTNAAEALDRRFGWDKLPRPLALLTLIGLRNRLREKNLYDTGRGLLDHPEVSDHPRYLGARTLDGTYNDLDDPLMGSLGSRFGRNVPLEATFCERDPLEPNPRLVSRELLTRERRSTSLPRRKMPTSLVLNFNSFGKRTASEMPLLKVLDVPMDGLDQ